MSKAKDAKNDKSNSKKNRYTKISSIVVTIAFIMVLCTFIYLVSSNNGNVIGYRLLFIQTDSMSPLLSVNDVILSKSITLEEAKNIKVGDIVTYKMTTGSIKGYLNTHECVAEAQYDSVSKKWYIKTQGRKDGAPVEVVYLEQIEAVMVNKLPFVSKIYTLMKSTTGIATLVIVPLILMLILSSLRLIDILKDKNKKESRVQGEELESLTKQKTEEIAKRAVEDYKALEFRRAEIARLAIEEYKLRNLQSESQHLKHSDKNTLELNSEATLSSDDSIHQSSD